MKIALIMFALLAYTTAMNYPTTSEIGEYHE
jgi:hypothetical protein